MSEMNIETARHHMIVQQIRPWDVFDDRVLGLMADVPREEFVPAGFQNVAFADLSIPLSHGEVMMPPRLEARMLQALAVQPGETVLEIGTGSGFVTALLAKSARYVYSVECHADLAEQARARLAADQITNVNIQVGDAAAGWPQHGPYDVIAVTGSLPILPASLQESLSIGGRLFVIVGTAPVMQARLITRTAQNEFRSENLFETELPALRNAAQPEHFSL